jgi:hypothetical protein
MIATSIEQSKQLVRLGLDPKIADMCWVKDYTEQWVLIADTKSNIQHRLEGMYEYSGFKWQEHIALVPAWSLSALLEVMPKNAELIKMENDAHELYYEIDYMYTGYEDKDAVTAAYEMVHWLLENGYIKTKEK